MNKKIKTSTALIIIFACAVIFGGGSLAYFYMYGPTGFDLEVNGNTFIKKKAVTAPTTTTTTDTTADWLAYTNNRVSYSFKYPSSGLKLNLDETIKYFATNTSEMKDQDFVQFATNTNTYGVRTQVGVKEKTIEDWIGKTDAAKGYDLATYLEFFNKTIVGGKTAYTFQAYLSTYVMSGSNVYQITDHKGVAPETAADSMYQNWLSTFQFTSSNNAVDSQAPTNTSESITYSNSDYDFTMTLPNDWDKYKVKKTNIEGQLATYYFNLPTTDSLYAEETTTAYAGYVAPFVIGVMNKSDWTGSEDQMKDFGSKVGESDKYVFTYSQWQASPTDLDATTIGAQVKEIIASFQVN